MVRHDVKKISGSHLAEIAVEIPPTEPRVWHRQSGLQQPEIAEAWVPSVPFELIAMNLKNLGKTKEYRGHGYSASRLRARPYFWFAASSACLNFL